MVGTLHTPQHQRERAATVWTRHTQQQQRGAQLPRGGAPAEAVEDRAAQDHEQAGATLQAGEYPASAIENRNGEATPSAPDDPRVDWDTVVQPEPQQAGETELEQDQRGEDAEQVPDPQAEQALREAGMEQDAGELEEAARGDRND